MSSLMAFTIYGKLLLLFIRLHSYCVCASALDRKTAETIGEITNKRNEQNLRTSRCPRILFRSNGYNMKGKRLSNLSLYINNVR